MTSFFFFIKNIYDYLNLQKNDRKKIPKELEISDVTTQIFEIIESSQSVSASFRGINWWFDDNDLSKESIKETFYRIIDETSILLVYLCAKKDDGIINLKTEGIRSSGRDVKTIINAMLFISSDKELPVKGVFNKIKILVEKDEKRSPNEIREKYLKDFDSQITAIQ